MSDRNNPFRNGRFQVQVVGANRRPINDLYYSMLRTSWARLFGLAAAGYLVSNALFAALYLLGGDCITGARVGHFGDAFYFSVQTMSTIGYGAMSPATPFAHVLVTIESFLGLIAVAVGTGLVFSKFSRPQARVAFSKVAVVRPRNGVPCLLFRVANERDGQIVAARMKAAVLVEERTAEGQSMGRMVPLRLERERLPLFTVSWTAIHPLDEDSPLFGLSEDDVEERVNFILLTLSGTDDTFLDQVHALAMYEADSIRFGHGFSDIIARQDDGTILLDHSKLHDTSPT
ncbi:MAG: ATP-sensitive inward rectifier potassium channel 10 [Deltaproteobacteria bacterium]|nr:ATP-sensitive inward rectifier potassium channel 10 [Deltaproteobacteria bacterium]